MACCSTTPRYTFCINQGADLSVPIVLTDSTGALVNLSGYSASTQIRTNVNSSAAIDTLTTENGRITLDPTAGKLTLIFSNAITETYPAQKVVYDIEITSAGGQITRILEGTISVSAEVTRVTSTTKNA